MQIVHLFVKKYQSKIDKELKIGKKNNHRRVVPDASRSTGEVL